MIEIREGKHDREEIFRKFIRTYVLQFDACKLLTFHIPGFFGVVINFIFLIDYFF